MVEVYVTNIEEVDQARRLVKNLGLIFPDLRFAYDMNETSLPFPAGHTVIRVEGAVFDAELILALIRDAEFKCEIMDE